MPELTIHCVVVYCNKKDPDKYMSTSHTLSGTNLSARIETIFTVDASSWSDKWELVDFSHAFIPPGVKMSECVAHCIAGFRNKKDPGKYKKSIYTLSGSGLPERVAVDASNRSEEWKLVTFSHAFMPHVVRNQF